MSHLNNPWLKTTIRRSKIENLKSVPSVIYKRSFGSTSRPECYCSSGVAEYSGFAASSRYSRVHYVALSPLALAQATCTPNSNRLTAAIKPRTNERMSELSRLILKEDVTFTLGRQCTASLSHQRWSND